MNFDLENKHNKYVKRNDLESVIQITNLELSKIPQTESHNWLKLKRIIKKNERAINLYKYY